MTLILIISGRNDDSVAHEVLDAMKTWIAATCWQLKPESSAQKPGDETELTEREEPERGQPETTTSEACLMRFGTTASTWQSRRR